MLNTERIIKHAAQEKLNITLCINKVCLSLSVVFQFHLLFVCV